MNHDLLEASYAREETSFMRRFPEFRQSNFVQGEGPDHTPTVMVIGEAPGAQEDAKGRPFCGASGIILRMLMGRSGLHVTDRSRAKDNTWLTNVVKLRPPGNRTPTPEQIELAKPFLYQEWSTIGRPEVIICVGNTALMAVTGKASVTKRAGDFEVWINSFGTSMYVWPMIHPSAAVRNKPLQPILESHWNLFSVWFGEYPF